MNSPTEQQINRRIAEWMGLCPHEVGVSPGDGTFQCGLCHQVSDFVEYFHHRFTTSHDACASALERMTEEKAQDFVGHLCDVVLTIHTNRLLRATARQKALAIYKTITKGVE